MRRINKLKLSIYSLILVGVLILLFQSINYFQFQSINNDGNLINISGRQRMLSQKLAKNSIAYYYSNSSTSKHSIYNVIKDDIGSFRSSHQFLLSNTENKEILKKLNAVQHDLVRLIESCNEILDSSENTKPELVLAAGNIFLPKMNKIVLNYEAFYERKQSALKQTFIFTGFILIIILCGIILFFLFPQIKRIEEMNKMLLAQNEELKQFVYIASHDLQEPVRTIKSFSDILIKNYEEKLDEKGLQMLNFLEGAGNRMSTLIKDLLDHSRLGLEKNKTLTDCNELVDDVIKDLKHEISTSNAAIEISKLPTFPAYRTEMRLLFQNLISNALKFRKKSITPLITISSKKDRTHHIFQIADNGIGIDPIHGKKIFNMFTQLHKRNVFEGSGIGLAHCKKIVKLHEGEISLETINEITVFRFTIIRKNEKT